MGELVGEHVTRKSQLGAQQLHLRDKIKRGKYPEYYHHSQLPPAAAAAAPAATAAGSGGQRRQPVGGRNGLPLTSSLHLRTAK